MEYGRDSGNPRRYNTKITEDNSGESNTYQKECSKFGGRDLKKKTVGQGK
jgi:hypothetical protein